MSYPAAMNYPATNVYGVGENYFASPMNSFYPPNQSMQPQHVSVPPAPQQVRSREKKILRIMDPSTKETINQADLEKEQTGRCGSPTAHLPDKAAATISEKDKADNKRAEIKSKFAQEVVKAAKKGEPVVAATVPTTAPSPVANSVSPKPDEVPVVSEPEPKLEENHGPPKVVAAAQPVTETKVEASQQAAKPEVQPPVVAEPQLKAETTTEPEEAVAEAKVEQKAETPEAAPEKPRDVYRPPRPQSKDTEKQNGVETGAEMNGVNEEVDSRFVLV